MAEAESAEDLREAGRWIDEHRAELAHRAVEAQYAAHPELLARWGERGKALCLEDTGHTLAHLAQALAWGEPTLFEDYVAWARVLFRGLSIPESDFRRNLETLGRILQEELGPEKASPALGILGRGLEGLAGPLGEDRELGAAGGDLAGLARDYLDLLLRGQRREAFDRVLASAERGVPVQRLYLEVFQPSLREVGRLWQTGRISVAQEHYCTAATQTLMSRLYPVLFTGERKERRLVAACVPGELHEVGSRMVADFFEMEGWDTTYLGANTPDRALVGTLLESPPHVLALSATLTQHVAALGGLVRQVREESRLDGVRILVGGRPFLAAPDLWRKVGADGTAPDARAAVKRGNLLAGEAEP